MNKFLVVANQKSAEMLSVLPGYAATITIDNYWAENATRFEAFPAVKKIYLEPDFILVDHLASILGEKLAEHEIKIVRTIPDGDGYTLLKTPDYQFPKGVKRRESRPEDKDSTISMAREVIGFLTEEDMQTLWDLAWEGDTAGHIAEIGSWCGKSSSILSNALRLQSEKNRLFCIDQWVDRTEPSPYDNYNNLVASLPQQIDGRIMDVFLYQARLFDYEANLIPLRTRSERILPLLGIKFKMVFIDADHFYASVKRDAQCAMSTLKKGGIIAFHDVFDEHPDVLHFVDNEFSKRSDVQFHSRRGRIMAFTKI